MPQVYLKKLKGKICQSQVFWIFDEVMGCGTQGLEVVKIEIPFPVARCPGTRMQKPRRMKIVIGHCCIQPPLNHSRWAHHEQVRSGQFNVGVVNLCPFRCCWTTIWPYWLGQMELEFNKFGGPQLSHSWCSRRLLHSNYTCWYYTVTIIRRESVRVVPTTFMLLSYWVSR